MKIRSMKGIGVLGLMIALCCAAKAWPQAYNPRTYDTGSPTLTDIWVDRAHGSDSNSGATRAEAVATLNEAWNRIPGGTLTVTGYRIQLAAGRYPEDEVPAFWEARRGSYQFPIILNSADGRGMAVLPNLNIYDCHYFYLIGIQIEANGGDALHFELCSSMLVRNAVIKGIGDVDNYEGPQEAFKVNQSQYIYVEDSDISGGWDNAIDFVAVQYGHIVGNRIHRAHEWCMYLKGGSAGFRIEGNELYDAVTGGFTAGQGTGFEYMVSPWLHYEAYDFKFFNNIIHDVEGPGMGVNGGYNVLLAYNTLYRVGRTSHGIEIVFGSRSCDGDAARCHQNLLLGGWGTDVPGNAESIPSRNVFVYNNLLLNPDGYASAWQHFAVYGPRTAAAAANIPTPVRSDVNLQIRGNVIWNGPTDLPLGIEGEDQGCQATNPTCFAGQLRSDNAINTLKPVLVNPSGRDFRPAAGSGLFTAQTFVIPDFPGGDRPQPPQAPAGLLDNQITRDFDLMARASSSPPGAFVSSISRVNGQHQVAGQFDLAQNYPNPFNPETTISFSLPENEQVKVTIFDVDGRQVRILAEKFYPAGRHALRWDGLTESGKPAAAGAYFCQVQCGERVITRKMLLIK